MKAAAPAFHQLLARDVDNNFLTGPCHRCNHHPRRVRRIQEEKNVESINGRN